MRSLSIAVLFLGQLALIMAQTNCKKTVLGKSYTGTLSMTVTEKTCQAWSSNKPHEHSVSNSASKDPRNFPDGSVAAAQNFCRNPDNTPGGPWCYTMDANTRWEYCSVPLCDCKKTALGRDYSGKLSTTTTGKQCQAWTSQTPHEHDKSNPASMDPSNFPDGSLDAAQNYCRNPDNTPGGPWCYTTDANTRWEYCDVPFCDCKKTVKGKEYAGKLSVTKSGQTCQLWTSNTPHEHSTSNPASVTGSNFPEGNVDAAENYCRNPDGTSGGPWCYTTNENLRFEHCDIPLCDCKRNKRGKDYAGFLSVTKSGKECQEWTSNTPHEHAKSNPPSVDPKNFPEGNIHAAKNFCRNPDDSPDGPWCYTMYSTRYEYCDVLMCEN